MNKKSLVLFLAVFMLPLALFSQEVLLDLEVNPVLIEKKAKKEKSIMNNQEYYILDTLDLPFIDDFSTNKLKRYYNWEYPAPSDSMAIRWTLNGDTLPTAIVSEDTTYHYYYRLDSVLNDTLFVNISNGILDSSVALISYQVIYFNGVNPFVPNDTVYYWPTEETYTFYDSLGTILANVSASATSITLTNANDTVWVYQPDTGTLWTDNFTFINSTYPVYPPSVGVATLDGVDENGMPYDFVVGLPEGTADYLTSKPIKLANYEPADSLYLSFYYQPQGRGNAPEQSDSLILEFRTSVTNWTLIWSAEGDELPADSMFKQVMIAVDTSLWFTNDFQFRFRNHATLSGNVDHWHIDYVRLSNARHYQDTVYEDVAYVYPAYSLLNKFQSMPWSHFLVDPASFMNDTLLLTFHNNLNAVKNTGYRWKVFDENNTELFDKNGGSKNYAADIFCQNVGTQCDPTDPLPMSPDFTFAFPDNGNDSAEYTIIASLATNPDNIKDNDTLHYTQIFHNYYAYDDGTAENGYGLEIQAPVGVSMAAYRFNMIKGDTLRGVRFYFNPQLDDVSEEIFSLMVWTGDNTPETLIYQKDSLSPQYSPGLNYFRTYTINDTILELQAGNFFVGWMQTENYRMNVGFDRNLNANENMFYNILGGGWLQSQLPGAWMIRPVFSSDTLPSDVFSIDENSLMSEFTVFPNPASDEVYIVAMNETVNSNNYFVNIFNSTGSVVKQVSSLPRSVNISELAPGFYFINIQNKETQEQRTYKLVISR
ncbi:MAG: hypothetical protein POELPBGB_00087 [Bacteroidia bacterium]|nr:hypothetical protein [Bacteroidia bacterium]